MYCSSAPSRFGVAVRQVGRQVDDGLFVAESRAVPEAPQLLDPAGSHPDLFCELAERRRLGWLAFLVACAGRDLEEVHGLIGDAELPHEQYARRDRSPGPPPPPPDGGRSHGRTRMPSGASTESLSGDRSGIPRTTVSVPRTLKPSSGAPPDDSVRRPRPRRRRRRGRAAAARRPSALASDAATSSRNSGCGRSGRLLNSG